MNNREYWEDKIIKNEEVFSKILNNEKQTGPQDFSILFIISRLVANLKN